MTEKRVLEDFVMSGVTQVRHQHWYPTAVRMGAGAFHAFNTLMYVVGGATAIFGKDVVIDTAQRNGMGIQASSSLGMGVVFLGALMLVIALVNAWAAFALFSARQGAYWYVVLINVLSFLWMAVLTVPNGLIPWMQTILSFLIAFLLLFDPRVKAFFYKGPFAESWWDEEFRRRRTGQGS